ncbi:MAG: formimidoylglutamate deiminase [Pseudomonadota bacterium]
MRQIWAREALTPEGWRDDVLVTLDFDGRIESVEPDAPRGGHVVGRLIPAPANLHSHAFQRAMAGLTERRGPDPRDTFWTWRRLMYRFLEQLDPDDVSAIAALVQIETLEAGFASIGEFHYLHHSPDGAPYADPGEMSVAIIRAADETGIGLTLLPVLYEVGGCDGRALAGGQRRFGTRPDAFAALLDAARKRISALPPYAVFGVAPHSLRAVTKDGLTAAVALAGDGPIHVHVAEQTAEVEEVLADRGARPVEWLLANAPVGAHWCLIHATQMTGAETRALAASHAVAGLCPITESNLGDGIFDGVAFTAAHGRYGVGSDSNVRISLAEELRTLDYSQRLRDQSRAALAGPGGSAGRTLLEAAAHGGAQALRRAAGAIAPGMWADLTALDDQALALCGRRGDAALDSWIFAGDDRLVTDVWSAGRRVVAEGRHIARDAVEARYRAVIARLGDAL